MLSFVFILYYMYMENNGDIAVSVVIPMYNEEEGIVENLNTILSVMDKSGIGYELLIVDDGSTDKSYTSVKDHFSENKDVVLLKHSRNMGVSEALRLGFYAATGKYVSYLDADLQYDPHDVVRFYRYAEEWSVPVVWGLSDKSNYPILRKIVSKGHNLLVRVLFGVSITIDINSVKLIERERVLEGFRYTNRKEAFNLELLLHSKKNGYTIESLPITVGERIHGSSKYHSGLIFQSLKSMFSVLFNK